MVSLCCRCASVSTERAVTCDDSQNVHRLSCDLGVVVVVQSALYGRVDKLICSEGRPAEQLTNTHCSLSGVKERIQTRCDGKSQCELNTDFFRSSDPCVGTYKYLETNYTCFPASEFYFICIYKLSWAVVHSYIYLSNFLKKLCFSSSILLVLLIHCSKKLKEHFENTSALNVKKKKKKKMLDIHPNMDREMSQEQKDAPLLMKP
ncbi:hypothetical protein NL108_016810 [Boleophthalmus pectinirostris]|uniref:L-rhamnose-binding lectin SML-like n=1 Tax=Boleophthalmus pectinirostris TaxID=150288 RepID=UPI00242D8705|nr:L-rhamnose-binding lectin SML-like [Boleophthalmus pectinirostris]KAJ0037151.1 hypothetical protein NL108_016810 [Boleophthalmus pectinirostris]